MGANSKYFLMCCVGYHNMPVSFICGFFSHSYPISGLPRWLSDRSACQNRKCRCSPCIGKMPAKGNSSPLQYSLLSEPLGKPHNPLQCSCLENPMDEGAWWAAVHGVAKSWARLSNFTSTFHFHALEKEMATPSSVLAWRIPGTEEPSGLPSMGSHRVGHD